MLSIIGAGPAGYSAAMEAVGRGIDTTLFEGETIGGTCLNVGCIPTKTLLHDTTSLWSDVQKRKGRIIRRLQAGIKSQIQCPIIQGHVTFDGKTITCDGTEYHSDYVLICTGSQNFVPPIPGVEDTWNSTDAINVTELPQSVCIIGGGVIGCEIATIYSKRGVKVTLIEAQEHLLPNIPMDLTDLLVQELVKRGVVIHTGTKVERIDGGVVHTSGGSFEAEKVLVAIGRRPRLDGISGVEINRGIVVDDYMRTSLPNVYAAGDCTGGIMLAHVATLQAHIAVQNMLGNPLRYSDYVIPSVVYTDPEISCVGVMEGAKKVVLPLTTAGRFMIENETFAGKAIMYIGADDTIRGVYMIGNGTSEFLSTATIAIQHHLTVSQFRETVFAHPTCSEILHELVAHI